MLAKVERVMKSYIEELDDSYSLKLFEKIPNGKRLRAKLILKITGETKETIALAAIVELIHAASLLHDDVIDDADTRRGVESINATFGNKNAIMLGDILYSKAFSKLVSFDDEIAHAVSGAVAMLSVGELLDVELSRQFNTDENLYFDMIYKKTAVLIEAAAASAAILADKSRTDFALYGKNLGLAFQIIDDVLDITMDSQTLGKPALNDFKEGKTTLPYIYLYEYLDNEEKAKLQSFYKKELIPDEIIWIKTHMKESGAIEKSVNLAQKLGYEALEAIEHEQNKDLQKVMKDMIERDF